MAATRCRKGGQVNEPNTITTGFSARSRGRSNSTPPVSVRVRATASSPIPRPVSSKSSLMETISQPLFKSVDSTGPSICSSPGTAGDGGGGVEIGGGDVVVDGGDGSAGAGVGAGVGCGIGIAVGGGAVGMLGGREGELSASGVVVGGGGAGSTFNG